MFWYGDDEVPVNQVLGNTLPVRAPLPKSAPSAAAPSDEGTAPWPSASAEAPAPSGDDGAGTWFIWTVFGIVVVAAVGGGFLYLRRRTQQV